MSLKRESIVLIQGVVPGDVKVAAYDITFTANQLVEPTNDIGWFLLNGAVISQSLYPILFARFGTTFNTGGEGAGNFRLPNHTNGNTPIGKGLTNFTTFGTMGGEIDHTLSATSTSAEIPTHTHGSSISGAANSHNHTDAGTSALSGGAHTHTYTLGVLTSAGGVAGTAATVIRGQGAVNSSTASYSHAHTVTSLSIGNVTESFSKSGRVSDTAAGGSHNNMMPYIVLGGLLVKHD